MNCMQFIMTSKKLKGDVARNELVQHKHFIEDFYLTSGSSKHFLVIYCVWGTTCAWGIHQEVLPAPADMMVLSLQLSGGQRETVTVFHIFELKLFDMVYEN